MRAAEPPGQRGKSVSKMRHWRRGRPSRSDPAHFMSLMHARRLDRERADACDGVTTPFLESLVRRIRFSGIACASGSTTLGDSSYACKIRLSCIPVRKRSGRFDPGVRAHEISQERDSARLRARFPCGIDARRVILGENTGAGGGLRSARLGEWSFFEKAIYNNYLQRNFATRRVLFVQHPCKNGLRPPV